MKHRPEVDHKHKHKPHPSKLTWLLALEVVTGVIAGLVFLVALLMALHRCKEKPLSIIPWKKPGTDKDCMTIIVGKRNQNFIFYDVCIKKKKMNFFFSGYTDTDMLKDVRRYSRRELEFACEDFSNIIGSSSDSIVYKGTMKGGPEIAVISLSNQEENWTSYLELYFQKEVKLGNLCFSYMFSRFDLLLKFYRYQSGGRFGKAKSPTHRETAGVLY